MKKVLFYFCTIVLIVLLDTFFSKFLITGLLFVIFIGLYRGSYAGCNTGFVIGLLEGVFSSTSFGVLSFSYAVIGYLAGRIPKRIDEANPIAQILVVLAGFIISQFTNLVIEMLFTGAPLFFTVRWVLISVLFTPVFFIIFNNWWFLWFNKLTVER